MKKASRTIASIFSVKRKKKKFDPFKDEIPKLVEQCVDFLTQYCTKNIDTFT